MRVFERDPTLSPFSQVHRALYDGGSWRQAHWRGVPIFKFPTDLWTYQEVIVEERPDVIVETGTLFGGSALFFASIMEMEGHGEVISIDINLRDGLPLHPRITYLLGSSTDAHTLDRVSARTAGKKTMVVLDSDHTKYHVWAELNDYGPLVTPGCLMVVEDTNINGHPVADGVGEGPWEAVEKFISDPDCEFGIDRAQERFSLTFFPCGWLRKLPAPTGTASGLL